ncbi:MAG TPA: hypothetical protein ENN09_00870, partial [Planctomycetes bacterium]|nr:hypothetical protein [Planctomycetota bacterium]
MKQAKIATLALLACALAAGCFSQLLQGVMGSDTEIGHAARTVGKGVDAFRKIPYDEELEYGRALAAQAIHYGGCLRVPEVERYLNLVANAVGAYSDRPSINYYVMVLNKDELNALSAPAGFIFLTWRILLVLEDEAQLAGILGHEIAHVCEKHVLDTMQNVKRK